MSSSDQRSPNRRALLLLLAAAPLAACGFTPAYAPGGPAAGILDRVTVEAPVDKNGFDLVERLEERLGRPRAPAFRLSYKIATESIGQAITPDNAITRYQITGRVDFTLYDAATAEKLSDGTVATFTAYSASGTPVSAATSETDAYARLMRLLADQIVTRLIATSGAWNQP